MNLLEAKNVYFVGIKGSGMVALVEILKKMGKKVWGSDVGERFFTDEILHKLKIKVNKGFNKKNIKKTEIDLVIASAAYGAENEEIIETKKKGIEMLYYPEALGQIFSAKFGIGIVGTHGKTSTTAMLGIVMQEADYKPTVAVGTGVRNFGGGNCLVGGSDFMVAELCEYRRHFLHSKPKAAILTSIEMDHPDYFKNIYDVRDAFKEFLEQIGNDGVLVYARSNELDDFVQDLSFKGKKISYGFVKGDVYVPEVKVGGGKQVFDVRMEDHLIDTFELEVPGKHQVLNACGVIAMCLELGLPLDKIKAGIKKFGGLKRRCEVLGEKDGVLYIDDYGHHPTEIKTTLAGLKEFYPNRKIWCVFQAHTYSRTKTLLEEFGRAFASAAEVLVCDIFASAREKEDVTVSGDKLAFEISRHHQHTRFTGSFEKTCDILRAEAKVGDLVVCMGAGDAYKVIEMMLK